MLQDSQSGIRDRQYHKFPWSRIGMLQTILVQKNRILGPGEDRPVLAKGLFRIIDQVGDDPADLRGIAGNVCAGCTRVFAQDTLSPQPIPPGSPKRPGPCRGFGSRCRDTSGQIPLPELLVHSPVFLVGFSISFVLPLPYPNLIHRPSRGCLLRRMLWKRVSGHGKRPLF